MTEQAGSNPAIGAGDANVTEAGGGGGDAAFGDVAALDAANDRIAELEKEVAALRAALAQADSDVTALDAGKAWIEALEKEVAALRAALSRADADAAALAKKAGKVSQAPKPAKPRAIKPMDPLDLDDRIALLEDLRDGDWQIAFSDGKREIGGLNPLLVHGGAFVAGHSNTVVLRVPVMLTGAAQGGQAYSLAGYGLIDPAGRQRAWCARYEPLEVPVGSEFMLRGEISF